MTLVILGLFIVGLLLLLAGWYGKPINELFKQWKVK